MNLARKFFPIVAVAVLAASCPAQAPRPATSNWVATWGTSQQVPEPANALPPEDLRDATVRQIFHLSIGGSVIRMHLSNAFGTEALHFTSVHIARPVSPASSAIDPASDRPLSLPATPTSPSLPGPNSSPTRSPSPSRPLRPGCLVSPRRAPRPRDRPSRLARNVVLPPRRLRNRRHSRPAKSTCPQVRRSLVPGL